MPHRVVDPGSLKNTKDSIGYYENLILNIKAVKRGDTNSVKMGMEAIRELEFDAGARKDQCLETGDPNAMTRAHGYQKMQEAYQSVLTMFEAPDSMISAYEDEIKKLQPFVDKYDPERKNK